MRVPTHGTVVAYLALFVALGGTAFALATNSVKSKHIKDGQVKLVDLNETALEDLLARGQFHGDAGRDPLRFYSYFAFTGSGETTQDFGDISSKTTDTEGEFRFCRDPSPVIYPWVLYLNGVRTTGTFPISEVEECTAPFDPGSGGDFRIQVRSTLIQGVHVGGPSEEYSLYGFGRF